MLHGGSTTGNHGLMKRVGKKGGNAPLLIIFQKKGKGAMNTSHPTKLNQACAKTSRSKNSPCLFNYPPLLEMPPSPPNPNNVLASDLLPRIHPAFLGPTALPP